MKKLICFFLLAALLLPCLGCADSAGGAEVTFFKAGKADAAVVRTGDRVLLVDTGLEKNGEELVASLRALGVEAIDALVISHFDKDHVGGADDILAAFPVGAVYQSNCPKDSGDYDEYVQALAEAGIEPVTVSETITFALDGLTVVIDGPAARYAEDPSNNSSLIVTAACGDTTVLFTGDAEDARLMEFMAGFERPEGTVVLKVPYHGHWQKTLAAFFSVVRPEVAVIPCSKSEPVEEELARTTALLESLGAEVHRTCDGDLSVELR